MLDVEILTDEDHGTSLCVASPAVIGRGDGCEIRLRHWRVARRHARLDERIEGVFVEDLGSLGGTLVNGRRILQYGPLLPEDEIVVGAVMLRVRSVGISGEDVSREGGPPAPVSAGMPAARSMAVPTHEAAMVEWRRRLHARLLEALDLRRRDVSAMSDALLRQEADRLLEALVLDADAEIPTDLDRGALRRQVVDEAVGLGPLESLLADPDISEIMVNRHDELYVECGGVLRRHPAVFSSDQSVLGVIERIVSPLGRRIDESSPMVDARLRDGSRVNAIIAPLALKGPALTIRKFPARRLRMADMVDGGSLDAHMAGFLRLCVERRKNVIVSGGTGSGKTTLLNILSNFIPPAERVITIEDAAELRLAHEHLVALEARPANLEGRGADRIVVGECRGAEALDMLQAMNTGHEGSLTTLHANTPRDAMSRLETLVLMAGMDLPLGAIREQIASAVDIVVQQGRSAAGQRRITAIVEVSGIESGRIQLQELFRFERPGAGESDGAGYFQGCELMPSFLDEWRAGGVAISPQWFCERTPAPDGPRSLA
ncbi:MAG: hypothetical protein ABT05_06675 [Lautropia sp. SCN 66-9]|nr:MAG: hypothetical protein ABT05_06675 [Lautropia sp. SCN 66-9]